MFWAVYLVCAWLTLVMLFLLWLRYGSGSDVRYMLSSLVASALWPLYFASVGFLVVAVVVGVRRGCQWAIDLQREIQEDD
jgi:hypothetical protein